MYSILSAIIKPKHTVSPLCHGKDLSGNTSKYISEFTLTIGMGLGANPTPCLIKFILSIEEKIPGIEFNSNPALAELIIKTHNPNRIDLMDSILENPNPGLTDFIKSIISGTSVFNFIGFAYNTNPLLADLIIKRFGYCYARIGRNPNPGLTDYILENLDKIPEESLYFNPNPKLAAVIIKLNKPSIVAVNPNPGLTEYLINCSVNGDVNFWCNISSNINPMLSDLLLKNLDKIDLTLAVYNPALFHVYDKYYPGLENNPKAIIIDKVRNKKILDSLL